jgi:hypothetical protein
MDEKSTSTQTKPRLEVFVVENWKNAEGAEQANWSKIGICFPHKDGKGYNVELQALPVGGKLVIREFEQKPKE